MARIARPLAAGFLGLVLLVGAACSDSPGASTASPNVQSTTESTKAAPSATQQTSVNQSKPELSTADVVKLAEPSIVRIETNTGVGTGFVVDSDGYLLTNNHVVEGSNGRAASNIRVTLDDGSVVAATVVGTDPRSDLAVLKVARTDLKALSFADLNTVLIGQDVVAIGYALDLQKGEGASFTVTRGIVSQKNRIIDEGANTAIYGAVQTDAAINHGNSGGPLLNMFGEVVGINTALAPDGTGGTASGIGFAVGSDVAKAVYEEIRADGQVNRGFLGIGGFEALRPAKAAQLNIPASQGGLVVGTVTPDGPVGAAGLKAGDVITRLGNTQVSDETDLIVALIKNGAGKKVTLEYYRDGKLSSMDVTLGTAS